LDNFITLITFTYPAEMAVLRARLEAEGIECRVLDELTVQVNPFYSNAIGGVKLQVKTTDIESAKEVLREGGYEMEKEAEIPRPLAKLDRLSMRIPIFSKLRLEFRLLIIRLLFAIGFVTAAMGLLTLFRML